MIKYKFKKTYWNKRDLGEKSPLTSWFHKMVFSGKKLNTSYAFLIPIGGKTLHKCASEIKL